MYEVFLIPDNIFNKGVGWLSFDNDFTNFPDEKQIFDNFPDVLEALKNFTKLGSISEIRIQRLT